MDDVVAHNPPKVQTSWDAASGANCAVDVEVGLRVWLAYFNR